MSKKNRAGLILLAGVLTFGAVGALASCGETPVEPNKPESVIKSVKISNKEALTAEWRVEEDDRTLEITTDPAINITEALDNGDIVVTSSDSTVIAAMNTKLKALKAGKATITVAAGEVKDTVEITVLARDVIECTSIKDVTAKAFKDGKFAPEDKIHTLKAAFVCIEPKGNMVITDGTDFFLCYGMQDTKDLKMGDNIIVEGKIAHYYGTMQFKSGKAIKLDTKDIKVPEAITFDKATLDAQKAVGVKNNDGPVSATEFYQPKLGTVTLKYTGKAAGKFLDKGKAVYDVKFNKCSEDMDAVIKTLGYGDTIEVTGGLIGWNNGFKYFNLIPTAIKVTKKAIQPTAIELAIAPQKQFDAVTLRNGVTLTPSNAEADITFEIKDDNKILQERDGRVLATKAGKVSVTPVANGGALKGKAVEVEFTAEKADNLITKATTKTIAEMLALDPKVAHRDALYLVEGKVTATKDGDDYGNITLTDADGKEFKTYGVGTTYLDFNFNEDGTVKYFSNPKAFKELIGKQFKLGDTIQLMVFADTHDGKASNKTVFVKRTIEAEPEPKPETPDGISVTYTHKAGQGEGDGKLMVYESGDLKLEHSKGTNTGNDVVNTYDNVRIYAGHTLTVSSKTAKKLLQVTFVENRGKGADGSNVTVVGGKMAYDAATKTFTITCNPAAEKVVISGEKQIGFTTLTAIFEK